MFPSNEQIEFVVILLGCMAAIKKRAKMGIKSLLLKLNLKLWFSIRWATVETKIRCSVRSKTVSPEHEGQS